MSDKSAIEWTDATWNPVAGCTKVSEGCRHCYIDRSPPFRIQGRRFEGPAGPDEVGATTGVRLHPDRLDRPLRWRRPRRIFVNSLSDLFHDEVPDDFIARVFGVMAEARWHTFQVLTKRPARMRSLLNRSSFFDLVDAAACELAGEHKLLTEEPWRHEWPGIGNVWLGTSVEDQKSADLRIPKLLATPAAVRVLSCEPLLGPVRLRTGIYGRLPDGEPVGSSLDGIDWVIAGGESGPMARPMHPDWARNLRDQCQAAGVPFFFKQWGVWRPGSTGPDDRGPSAVVARDDGQWFSPPERLWEQPGPRDELSRKGWALVHRTWRKSEHDLDGRTWDEMPAVTS